jgi:hypothetical protein
MKCTLSLMKIFCAVGLSTALLFSLLPSTAAARGSLKVEVTPPTSYLLPNAAQTCNGKTLSPFRFRFAGLRLSWTGIRPLTGATLVVAFQNTNLVGGEFLCEITGTDFDALVGTTQTSLPPGAVVKNTSSCALECGAVGLVDRAVPFHAVGTATVIGLSTELGQTNPAQEQASAPISIDYAP